MRAGAEGNEERETAPFAEPRINAQLPSKLFDDPCYDSQSQTYAEN